MYAVYRLPKSFARKCHHLLLHGAAIAKRARAKDVVFIGVTGSCGKTTTVSLTGAVLRSAGEGRIGAGLNTQLAVIRNLLSIGERTTFVIQEISGSRPGRVTRHAKLLKPQMAIITAVGTDHYRNFRSLEATAKEKGRLVELLPPQGTAILNADDPNVRAMAGRTKARVITFGLAPDADVRAIDVTSVWPDRLSLTMIYGSQALPIRTKLVGTHWTSAVLAALACGIARGIDLETCVAAIEAYEPWFGRYSVHRVPRGAVYVFDHKAPVWTVPIALDFIREARAPRKTVVFGTISDYPGSGGARYRRTATDALEVADRVIFVGPNAGYVTKLNQQGEFRDRLLAFQTTYQASRFLERNAEPDELLLLKGSLAVDHLERIILSQLGGVVCWRERCGKEKLCPDCAGYFKPSPPPFGLGEEETPDRPLASRPEFAYNAASSGN
jgi:UDP-N-acetylmuramoyl-tripeptide--D-alanyl-D-alanine ligase